MLCELLALYRRVNAISMKEMADRLGVSKSTYSRLEAGKGVDSATLLSLINFLFSQNAEEQTTT